jgi:hypothetical protein
VYAKEYAIAVGLPENADHAALNVASTVHVRGLQARPAGARKQSGSLGRALITRRSQRHFFLIAFTQYLVRSPILLREHYPKTSGIAMPRAKKHPKLSADERAFHNRLDCLNEEEIKQLTTREIFAYFKIIDKVDSRADVRRMVERAK